MKNSYYGIPSEMNGHSINDVVKNLFNLLAFQYGTHSLQYVRVTDNFDVVRRLYCKDRPGTDKWWLAYHSRLNGNSVKPGL